MHGKKIVTLLHNGFVQIQTVPNATNVLGAFLITNELMTLMHLERPGTSASNGAFEATARRASARG